MINQANMQFKASFCNPFQKDIIDLGYMDQDSIIENFKKIPWIEMLKHMDTRNENQIYYSPSLEIENTATKHGLCISAVGNPEVYEYYIFYKRPKTLKTFFGLKEKFNENYMTDKTEQTTQDVIDCLQALINGNTEFLDKKIGS